MARFPAVNTTEQLAAARLSLFSNMFLVVIKVSAGIASGSLSVLSEGVQSFLDILASAAILWTLRKAYEPPDREHPWGHGKLENLVSLVQIALILVGAGGILFTAWYRLGNPFLPRLDWGIVALSVSLLIDWGVSHRVALVANKNGSAALHAEAVHLRTDMYSCAGVLGGLVLAWITHWPWLDPAIAALMALVIIASAVKLMKDTVRPLMDEKLPPEEEAAIRKVLDADVRVLQYHRLRTRRAGSLRHMDVHILLDDGLSFSQSHAIAEDVENSIRDALPGTDVIVHAEPYYEEMQHQNNLSDETEL
ncbi:MAG: cation diffusion facilitator family transporter [Abditibacteriaceae bacterium]